MRHESFLAATCALVFGGLPLVAAAGDFKFRHHFLDRQLPGNSWAQTALADLDKDGRLDYITGQTRGPLFWYRQEASDRWMRHPLGTDSPSDVGGAALDVDGDSWMDFVAGGVWYRNAGRPRTEPFERIVFDPDLAAVHDLVVADVDRDGQPDVLTMSDKNNLRWYRISNDPRQPWERYDIGPGVHAGIGAGDIDGDGDLDVARSNCWFENVDSKGTRWVRHENIPFGNPKQPYPLATLCVALDLDRDGDTDLVMTENEIKAGRIGWLENLDGRGGGWKLRELPKGDPAERGAYHSLAVADFDNDGDPDVFSCEMEGIPGDRPPRWFIWENLDGKGGQFIEHVVLDANLGGHLVVAGDTDGDGDVDLIGKLWRPRKDNANEGRNHIDLLENRLVLKDASLNLSSPGQAKSAKPTRLNAAPVRWERRVLTDRYYCDGIHGGDFNRDGQMDVVAGPFWYEGPRLENMHEIYPPKEFPQPPSPTDSLYSFVYDFNGDGWPDVLVLGRVHLHQAFWYENPQGKPGHWKKHYVHERVQAESPVFADIDQDGRPEIVCIFQKQWGMVKPDWNAATQPWAFQPIVREGDWNHFYHGTGVGDVNGDGRPDLLMNDGWWERPAADSGQADWIAHRFKFAGKGGAQMFAYDVDADGDNDIITSLDAHGWGLSWFEQLKDGGKLTFSEHKIMGDRSEEAKYGLAFSQPHALDLADIDGDGLMDIVIGKRVWAHGPKGDVEPEASPVLYWFQLQRDGGQVRYAPRLIDDQSGVGCQVVAADVNGDGRPDILTVSKLGAFVFFNRTEKP